MKLRSRLHPFSAALLSALGASPLLCCGGSAIDDGSRGTGGGTSANGSVNHYPCKDPTPIGNGVVQCDGFKHRTEIATCDSKLPRSEVVIGFSPSSFPACKMDADCVEFPYGWCSNVVVMTTDTYCEYGCVKDGDCAPNQLCECGDPVGRCVNADCTSDAGCGAGFLCKSYDASGGCLVTTYTCQSAADSCGSDTDCVNSGADQCLFDATERRFSCAGRGCIIGRPFLVAGEQRSAPARHRTDWSDCAWSPSTLGVDAAVAAHLATQWTRVALLEHASIAAFARFSLQLLSLGAPPELIELTTAAMVDETKHAKSCFAVASHFAARPVGPGRLVVEKSLDEMSLHEIVLSTIREGCVGETVAAIEAREAAEHAVDPVLRELLLVLSQDELRHAELAFRFVKWALAEAGAALASAVESEFAALAREAAPRAAEPALTAIEEVALRYGVVPGALRRSVRARAIAEIILPCSRALCGASHRFTSPATQSVHNVATVVAGSN